MSISSIMSKDVRDFRSSYTFDEQILLFWSGMKVSSSGDEDWVILEACSPSERVTTLVSSDHPSSHFFFYLYFIKDMKVLFPISHFSMEVLRVFNIVSSQLFSNNWGYIRAFEMVCEELVITPNVGVFFSFYTTKPMKGRWVSLSS